MTKTIAVAALLLAVARFGAAAEVSAANIDAAYHRSIELETVQKYTESISALAEVYRTYPETYTVNLRLGWLYYLNGNYENALKHARKALQLAPVSIEALNIATLVHAARGDWVEVEESSARILGTDYYNRDANVWYAVGLKMQGKYSLAARVARKMLAVYPTDVRMLQELGENLFLVGDKDGAMAVFATVRTLSPGNAVVKHYGEQAAKQ